MKITGPSSFSFEGIEYRPVGGMIELPDAAGAIAIASHGFAPWIPPAAPQAPTPAPVVEEQDDAPTDDPAKMSRKQLFAFLKGAGVSVPVTMTTDKLHEIAADVVTKRTAESARQDAEAELEKDLADAANANAAPATQTDPEGPAAPQAPTT